MSIKVFYYPGCSLQGTAQEYDASIREICTILGIDLVEIDDWSCCGASSAHSINHELSVLLPARNLALAEEQGGSDLLVPCSACYNRLKFAHHSYKQDPNWQDKIPYQGGVEILHLHEFFARPHILKLIEEKRRVSLDTLKIIPYYGCMSVRPPSIVNHPQPDNPCEMDRILEALGANVLPWSYKVDCCGGNQVMIRPEIAEKLCGDLLDAVVEAGGEMIVSDCPMCQSNLDTRQNEIEKQRHQKYHIPVFYITELIGLALGCENMSNWWNKHLVSPRRIVDQIQLAGEAVT